MDMWEMFVEGGAASKSLRLPERFTKWAGAGAADGDGIEETKGGEENDNGVGAPKVTVTMEPESEWSIKSFLCGASAAAGATEAMAAAASATEDAEDAYIAAVAEVTAGVFMLDVLRTEHTDPQEFHRVSPPMMRHARTWAAAHSTLVGECLMKLVRDHDRRQRRAEACVFKRVFSRKSDSNGEDNIDLQTVDGATVCEVFSQQWNLPHRCDGCDGWYTTPAKFLGHMHRCSGGAAAIVTGPPL